MTYGRSQLNRERPAALFLLSVIAALLLTACLVLAGRSAPTAQSQTGITITPTVIVPGMPSCGCSYACGDASTPVAATPVSTSAVGNSGGRGRIVAIDPGHGGRETGAVSASGLIEKNVNLKVALKLAALLRQGDYVTVLTRNTDSAVNVSEKDLNGNGVVDNDDDLQARVDIANAAHADIILSLHNDSSTNTATRGTTTYYCDARPFSAESIRLASDIQRRMVASMHDAGYDTLDKGISDDAPLKKPYGHLFVLGPLTPRVARASNMPGALGETLYLSNPKEAVLLAGDAMLSAIARGYYEGIVEYFGSAPR